MSDSYILNCIVSGTDNVPTFANTLGGASTRNYAAGINYGNTPLGERFPFYYAAWTPTIGFNYWESGSLLSNGTGSAYLIGITGSNSSNMLLSSSYNSWDFVNVWKINPLLQNGYPYLSGQNLIAPTITVISPNGGETYLYSQMIPISWSFSSGSN